MRAQSPAYKRLRGRMRRSLYYTPSGRMDRLTLPLSEAAASYFDAHSPFDYLDMEFATSLNREAMISPASLLVALLYLDRLRAADAEAFAAASPEDLYLSALLLANKFLQDEGEADFVYNDEWAASAGKSLSHVNKMELDLLNLLRWDLRLNPEDFEGKLNWLEMEVARVEAGKKNWSNLAYSEIRVLLRGQNSSAYFQPLLLLFGLASLLYSAAALALNYALSSLLLSSAACSAGSSLIGTHLDAKPILGLGPLEQGNRRLTAGAGIRGREEDPIGITAAPPIMEEDDEEDEEKNNLSHVFGNPKAALRIEMKKREKLMERERPGWHYLDWTGVDWAGLGLSCVNNNSFLLVSAL